MIDITFGLAHADSSDVATRFVYVPTAVQAQLGVAEYSGVVTDNTLDAVYDQEPLMASVADGRIVGRQSSSVLRAVLYDRAV